MEHNFNPNKGDYKYILAEEHQKKTGEVPTPPVSQKQNVIKRFWRKTLNKLLLSIRFKRTDRLKIAFPFLIEIIG